MWLFHLYILFLAQTCFPPYSTARVIKMIKELIFAGFVLIGLGVALVVYAINKLYRKVKG